MASVAGTKAGEEISPPASRDGRAVRLVEVTKEFPLGSERIRAVDHVSLSLPAGQFVAVVGRSGSGKTTLLNLLAGIDTPTGGEVWIGEHALSRLSDDDLTRLRRDRIGMVYQFFNLLTTLTVRENVALPALLAGEARGPALERAEALLAEVDMSHRLRALPHTLSGGEMQRTALARALINRPALVLADEPTGNLDSHAEQQVLDLLRRLCRQHGATTVLVTHSPEAAAVAERVVELHDGRVIRDVMA